MNKTFLVAIFLASGCTIRSNSVKKLDPTSEDAKGPIVTLAPTSTGQGSPLGRIQAPVSLQGVIVVVDNQGIQLNERIQFRAEMKSENKDNLGTPEELAAGPDQIQLLSLPYERPAGDKIEEQVKTFTSLGCGNGEQQDNLSEFQKEIKSREEKLIANGYKRVRFTIPAKKTLLVKADTIFACGNLSSQDRSGTTWKFKVIANNLVIADMNLSLQEGNKSLFQIDTGSLELMGRNQVKIDSDNKQATNKSLTQLVVRNALLGDGTLDIIHSISWDSTRRGALK